MPYQLLLTFAVNLGLAGSLQVPAQLPEPSGARPISTSAFHHFDPIPGSAECVEPPATLDGFASYQPFVLPKGYRQRIIASQVANFTPIAGSGGDAADMNTLNETGPEAGRYLYRTHETESNSAVTVTDLKTGETRLVVQANHYERLDGIVWSPWRTLLFAEELIIASHRDPNAPNALRGMLYELDPATGVATVRPAVGSRAHEGLRFDSQGNLYGISESRPGTSSGGGALSGGIFKFVPDRSGDLSSGQLYALKALDASRTGEARWVPLDRKLSRIDSDQAAVNAGASGWQRPEDIEIGTSTAGQQVMYVAITGENLVLKIELKGDKATVTNFVQNVEGFSDPDNLALDAQGNLFITEDDDPGDIWVARAGTGAMSRFASLSDCSGEPTGIYFDAGSRTLYVNVLSAGGELGNDLAVAITKE